MHKSVKKKKIHCVLQQSLRPCPEVGPEMGNLNSGLHWLRAFGNTSQLSGSHVGKWAERNSAWVRGSAGLESGGHITAHFKAVYFVIVELFVAEK